MCLAHTGFELFTKRTRKREFLDEMNLVIPWSELLALIAPHACASEYCRGCRHECACSAGQSPKTGPTGSKGREIGSKFSLGFAM